MSEPLSPNEILSRLEQALTPGVNELGGRIIVANDAFNVVEILVETSRQFRLILMWEGDEDATGQPLAGIVNNTVAAIVSHNRGIPVWRGESVYKDTPARKSLLTLVSDIRSRIRALAFPGDVTNERFLYLGATAETTPDGLPLDAYRLRFRLTTALPARSF
jgi:hypothetical protein